MKEYVPAIAAIIAGFFAVGSAFIAWKLKNSTDAARDENDRKNMRREERKALYTETFQLFEGAMREILSGDEFTLAEAFSKNNAKIHLLAPEDISNKYSEVACILESWSRLHAKASPRRMKVGEQTMTIIQAPDPTAQYKEPAKAEYEKLQSALQELVALMRSELDGHG
ncbi:hypothetical protein C4Q28_06160 [Pseudomonas sp. SWI6]|uniref:hypothetical protein n=1 Tax=Pseudomonas TaxID=286 RepID=UPI000CE5E83A|nr:MULTISPECIES: hypothetical protein [Pseudomonas]AVD81771.1 hypothetical protein C4Q28_06160 [Pseudomonas sp. SWI6]MDD2003610.1 hypothetical protein [Pseudomonas putida]UTH37250.1 hypothetical protein NLY39_03555 [Pseudomonas sp. KHPS1]CAB5601655.1 Uncharacterised protein [Pseudomonas putida]CAB5676155.1 Uncharacterised protein [Pseudomonas putida]